MASQTCSSPAHTLMNLASPRHFGAGVGFLTLREPGGPGCRRNQGGPGAHGVIDSYSPHYRGEMAEWLKAHAWKACIPQGIQSSNLCLSAIHNLLRFCMFDDNMDVRRTVQ